MQGFVYLTFWFIFIFKDVFIHKLNKKGILEKFECVKKSLEYISIIIYSKQSKTKQKPLLNLHGNLKTLLLYFYVHTVFFILIYANILTKHNSVNT